MYAEGNRSSLPQKNVQRLTANLSLLLQQGVRRK